MINGINLKLGLSGLSIRLLQPNISMLAINILPKKRRFSKCCSNLLIITQFLALHVTFFIKIKKEIYSTNHILILEKVSFMSMVTVKMGKTMFSSKFLKIYLLEIKYHAMFQNFYKN